MTSSGRKGLCSSLAVVSLLLALDARAALTLTMEMNPNPVRPGERLYTQITVTNNGASAVNNVTVEATVAPGIDDAGIYAGFDEELLSNGGTCNAAPYTNFCDSGEQMVWALGTIAGGSGITVTVPLPVSAAATNGTVITVPSRVLVAGVETLTTSATATVDTDYPLTVEVDDSQDPVAPGGTLTYTISYGNRSLDPVTDGTLTLPLPAGATLVSASDGGTQVGGNVQWNIGTIMDGQVGRRQAVVTVGAGALSGSVQASTAVLSGTGVGGAETARSTVVTRVRSGVSPRVLLELDPDPVRPGERLRGRITVFNSAATPLTGVVVNLRVVEGIDDPSVYAGFDEDLLSGGGTCNGLTYSTFCDSFELASWSVGTVLAGSSAVVTVPLPVAASLASGRLVTLMSTATTGSGVQVSNDHTVGVSSSGALSLELDGGNDAPQPGETLVYTATVGNRGLDDLTGTTLALPLPAGVTFVSASDGGTSSGGVVQWSLGTLFAGETDVRTATVQVNLGAAAGTPLVVDAAEARGTGIFTEIARAGASGHVETLRPVNVAVEMNPGPARPGERLRAQVTVSNPGAAPLDSVVLTARMPQEIDDATVYVGLDEQLLSGAGTCNAGTYSNYCDFGELMTWNLGALAPAGSTTLTIPMPVAAGTDAGRITVLETLVTAAGDVRASVEGSAPIDNDNPLVLEIDDSADPVNAGSNFSYTLAYSNRGTGPVTGATLALAIPPGTTRVNSTGGVVSGGVITWNLGTIAAGTGGRRQVTINAPLSLPGGTLVTAQPVLRGTASGLPFNAVAQSVTRVAVSNTLSVATALSPNPVNANQSLSSTITVRNDSINALAGVVLRARVPLEMDDAAVYAGFPETLLPAGGTCDALAYTNYCDPGELMTWNVGALAAGGTATVTVPMPVAAGTTAGRQVVLEAEVRDAGGSFSTTDGTVLVGSLADGDGDGVGNNLDNCTLVANPTQLDTDGDGFGNYCDGDLNNSGLVTSVDFNLLRSVVNQAANSSALAAAADMNGSGLVTSVDFSLLRQAVNGAPGPSALAP